jgi:glycosyltransferase involved in cell wall biosynthesis
VPEAANGRSAASAAPSVPLQQMRILFFSEGDLGTHVLGHDRHNAAMRTGLDAWSADHGPTVQASFASLTPLERWSNALATRAIEPLAAANLDFHTLRWHTVQSLRARGQLVRALREWPADWVHIHSHSISFAMTPMMHSQPIALSVDTTVRDWWEMPAWRSPQSHAPFVIAPSQALERRTLTRARLVLACTPWAQRAVLREAPRAHCVVHHPGIDLERYRPAPRRERERERVLFVGGRFREKGGEDLLAALGEDLGERVELDVVTPASVCERPGVRVHRLRAGDPELLDLFQQADVVCLPTYADSNPWTVLEGMACGSAVVSTRVGGIPDMLDHGRAGVVTHYGDRRSLREALLGLLGNAERRREIANRARTICEEHYDARTQFARLVEHMRLAAGRRGLRSQ